MEMWYGSRGVNNYLEINLGNLNAIVDKGNYYKLKMLESNHIPYLAKTGFFEMDGNITLRNDVTSLYVLDRMYQNIRPDGELFKLIMKQILDCIQYLGDYLLEADDLLINPEYMFYDVNKKEIIISYIPGYNKCIKQQLKQFLECIMKVFDHRDKLGMNMLYDVYGLVVEDDFNIYGVYDRLEKKTLYTETSSHVEKDITKANIEENYYDKERVLYERQTTFKDVIANVFTHRIGVIVIIIFILCSIMSLIKYILLSKDIYDLYICVAGFIAVVVLVAVFSFREEDNVDQIMSEYLHDISKDHAQEKIKYEVQTISSNGSDNDNTEIMVCDEPIKNLVPLTNGYLKPINLDGELSTIIIGRDKKDADYRLSTTQISKIHAYIYKKTDGIYVEDRNSTNGTFINNNQLKGLSLYKIKRGDLISFAGEEFFAS